jgi:hypothetical protein
LPSAAVYSARFDVPRRSSWLTVTSPVATARDSCLAEEAGAVGEK